MAHRLQLVHSKAEAISGPAPYLRMPYVFGGGHGPGFGPTLGILASNPHHLIGYDCSGFASAVLRAGGLLASPPAAVPLDTANFISWGAHGAGEFLTLWVRNDSEQQHCFLDFHANPAWPIQFVEAPHTGAFVHWFSGASLADFAPRHWPGT